MDNQEMNSDGVNETNGLTTKAEIGLWNLLKKNLESRNQNDAVFYLRHFIKPVSEYVSENGKYKEVGFTMYKRISDYSVQQNSTSGELFSWYFDKLREKSTRKLKADECLRIASAIALPAAGARLEESGYEKLGNDFIFSARWAHSHNEIIVEGDFIQVMVNGETGVPFSFSQKWHVVDETFTER